MKKTLVVLLVAILASAGGLLWVRRPVQVVAEEVVRGPLTDTLSATGVVEARLVILSPKVSGRIVEILVRDGQEVSTGQLLIRLDSEELAAQVSQSQAAVNAARAQLAQAEAALLVERAQVSAQTKQAEAQLAAAKAQLQKARAGARLAEIKAAEAQVAVVQIAYDEAARELDRIQSLYTQGAVARSQLDGALAARRAARAQVDAAMEQLALVRSGTRSEDLTVAEAQVAQAQAGLELAHGGSRLLDVRKAQVEAARAQVAQAAAILRVATAQLEGTLIRAPFSGTVVRIPANVGQLVGPGSPLLELADLTDRWVAVDVESDDLSRFDALLQTGGLLEVTSESHPARTFTGTVREIASAADRGMQGKEWTVRARVAVDDPQRMLRPGMEVDIDGQVTLHRDSLNLPKEAVVEEGGRAYAFVWNGATAKRVQITTGTSSMDDVEVVSGLREGDIVVVSGLDHLRRGHQVAVPAWR